MRGSGPKQHYLAQVTLLLLLLTVSSNSFYSRDNMQGGLFAVKSVTSLLIVGDVKLIISFAVLFKEVILLSQQDLH